MFRPPIKLHLLAHPKSEAARRFAQKLMSRFVEPPASGGLRIPTFFTPDRGDDLPPAWEGESAINLEEADHTLVVLLADARMMRIVAGGTGAAWKAFFDEGLRRFTAAASRHYVFGMALDDGGYGLCDQKHMLSITPVPPQQDPAESLDDFGKRFNAWLEHVIENAALQITIRAMQRLNPELASNEQRAPIRLFLSHAKADLSLQEDDPVRFVENDVKELPVDFWFDAARIPPSEDFANEINKGIEDCSIVVSFLTDHYASRPWCQREILDAKRLGVPILVVDALKWGEPRNFPYLGNLPTIRWSGVEPKLDARRVVSRAAREALRFIHNRQFLRRVLKPCEEDIVLATAPEALTLAHRDTNSGASQTYYYPDPPLTMPELDVLKSLLPSATFATPLTKIAQRLREHRPVVAVSISSSGELERQGLSPDHERTLSDEIHLYLLLAACQIAYGGSLEARFDRASNFTLRLFELVRSYSPLASLTGAKKLTPILNFAPWPLRLGYDDAVLNLFGNVADMIEGPSPSQLEIPEAEDELFPRTPDGRRLFPSDTPQRRLAWARGLTAMRLALTKASNARVVIGGRLEGYSGLYPGIIEEAWMSIAFKHPLYLVGAFGGAARVVMEAVKSGDPATIVAASEPPGADKCRKLAQSRGLELVDENSSATVDELKMTEQLVLPDRMAADFARAGQGGLTSALNNGLNDEENVELFRATEPTAIADLILTGLARLPR